MLDSFPSRFDFKFLLFCATFSAVDIIFTAFSWSRCRARIEKVNNSTESPEGYDRPGWLRSFLIRNTSALGSLRDLNVGAK